MSSPQDPRADTKALMARALAELRETRERVRRLEASARAPIAIIGMSCRFPGGADSAAAFEQLLWDGSDAISRVPADRWDAASHPDSSPFGGFIADVARFDAAFFGLSPREAESMDPQHRLLLETAWHALEHANIPPASLRGSQTGVFAGICTYDYAIRHLATAGTEVMPHFGTGNALSAAAGRLSYLLGFNGPSMSIDTACSSSLVAVHLAMQSLRQGECEIALAAGVNLMLAPQTTLGFSRANMLAPDGRCKPFDASANGYVRGEGCGVVILKRLADARRDGDPVLAVLRGSAINQDGASSGLTVPNGPAQQQVIRKALDNAGIDPADVSYVEAHGTGTALGDPIEARSLGEVYGRGRTGAPLMVGSVKSNIGHLEGAAGAASLIKAVLALRRASIPPTLHVSSPSGAIDWAAARLEVTAVARDWPAAPRRIAAVSSFGFTGTNAHVIVEAAEGVTADPPRTDGLIVVPISAPDPSALEPLVQQYSALIAARPEAARDVAAVAALGRQHFRHRRAIVVSPGAEAEALAARYVAGEDVDWTGVYEATARQRVRVPEYPFAGDRHWLAEAVRLDTVLTAGGAEGFGDHRVFGQVVVPAAGYVDLLLRAGRRVLGTDAVEIAALSIRMPLVLADDGRAVVRTTIEPSAEGVWQARIEAEGSLIASAEIRQAASVPSPRLPEVHGDEYPVALIYRECAARGLEYGPAFRVLRRVSQDGDVVCAVVAAEDPPQTGALLPPALLDGCLQAAAVMYPALPDGRLLLPVGVRQLAVYRAVGGDMVCRAALVQQNSERVEVQLELLNGAGDLVASADGVVLVAADRAALLEARQASTLRQLVPVWRETGRIAPAPADASRGRKAVVRAGEPPPSTSADQWVVLCPRDVATVEAPRALAWLRDTLVAAATRAPHPSRVIVVTAGAEAVNSEAPVPEQAALAALARTARAEFTDLRIDCVDLAPAEEPGPTLVDSLADVAGDAAYRDGSCFVRGFVDAATSAQPATVRSDATYVVSGGAGAVGLHLARWLVERGARTLVLLGRHAPGTTQQQAIDQLRARANVRVEQVDVADGAAVDTLFARLASELPPVAGIVHAAGVTSDGTLANLTGDGFAATWRPKVSGATHLLRHTRELAVDRVMLVGSIAGTFGAPGQANYAAANAWLEACAVSAHQQSLPVTCVSFGPWQSTGLAARLDLGARRAIESRGVQFLDVAGALAAFEAAWVGAEPHRVVYAGVAPAAPDVAARASTSAAKHGTVADRVTALVAEVLRSPAERIDPSMPLVAMGLDSLMALELRSHVRERFALDVSAADLVGEATVASLAAQIDATGRPVADARPASSPEPAELPLTQGQQALWYLHELQPGSPAYNIAFAVRIRSTVDVGGLRRRLSSMVARHSQLRRVYRQTDEGVRQRLIETIADVLQCHEAAGLSDEALFEAVRAAYREPFDLAQGPVFRADLFTRADDEHVLLLAMHHIAGDAWSLWQLLEELRGDTGIQPSPTFADRVAEEAAFLGSPEAEASWQYWQRELGGELPVLNLPTDRPRPAVQTLNGASVPFSLSAEQSRALQTLARREGATLYAVLLAAFQTLLHRWSGQSDIIVGCPTAGRERADARGTVGYFVNPIALRARVADGESFQDRLRDARTRLIDGMAHQRLPFPIVADRLGVRHADRSPVFQTAFVMQQLKDSSKLAALLAPSTPPAKVAWGDLTLEHYFLPQQEGQFDLTLEVVQAHGACHGLFKFNSDLWDAATIKRMTRHFSALLDSVVADPASPLGVLDLLPADERAALQDAARGPRRDYSLDVPLHRWIEQQAARTPGATAVVADAVSLTYADLNATANRLARELQGRGVGPGVLVPICAERGLGLIVGLLAIMKSGGAYVPLDPSYPGDRLRLMVADTAAPLVLAEARTQQAASGAAAGLPLVLLEDVVNAWSQHEAGNLAFEAATSSPAYAIFTSGSTGQPKGALNAHAAIVNRLCWMQEAFGLTAADRVLQKTPCSFDVSVWEFFWPLMTGAQLVFAKPDGHRDSAYLARLIREAGITTLHFVPPMLQAFLDEPEAADCGSLRRVICSGQELPATLQRRFFDVLPHAELHNLYGPTEAAVDVTWHRCRPDNARAFVPLGRPIANTAIYILDERRQPVPFGVAGELYIGGVQVGLGYLNRPELTAARFVEDPFGGRGARMYRTGDLARVHPNGEIEFLGRTDFQVKIRGLRVELGEIEHALASHPSVREALVVVRQDRPGASRLVAYLVAASGHDACAEREVREAIATALPAYMVPDAFVWLEAMPLTANGKVDRRALPAAAVERAASRPPATAAEQQLAAIWRRILAVEDVGVDDNFFSLGGDSISSTQMVAAARQAGFDLSVRDVLAHPTLAALAGRLAPTPLAITAAASDEGAEVPLMPMQRRFFEASAPRFEQAIVLHSDAPLDAEVLRAALADVVRRHDALRLRFPTASDGTRRQVVVDADQAAIAFEPAALDIEHGPMASAVLDGDRRSLRLTVHHLAVDGASWRSIVRDLEVAYRARLRGAAPDFGTEAASFRAWARAAAAFAASDAATSEALYWLTEPWSVGSPLQIPQADGASGSGAGEVTFMLPFTASRGETVQATLLAALATAWADDEPTTTLRVDLEGHGREPLPGADGTALVGWCTALFPVRLDVDGDSFEARVRAIEHALANVPAGGRAFGLCRDLSPNDRLRRALAAIPPAEVIVNYLGRVDGIPASASSLFTGVSLPAASELRDDRDRPAYPLEVNAYQQGGALHVALRFDRARVPGKWIESLAARCRALLEGVESGPYPLTPMQQGILFHSVLQPDAGFYIQQVVARFDGEPDVAVLRSAWDAVLQRHPSLRNAFQWAGLDAPQQQPVPAARMPWHAEDWRSKPEPQFEADLDRWLVADRARGFDLTESPLHRVQLFLARGGCTLVWTHHHILLDGRGMFLVLHEVLEHARAIAAGQAVALPPPASFRAFAGAHGQPASPAARDYWAGELARFTERTEIPFLSRAVDGAAYDSQEIARALSSTVSDGLRRQARLSGVSLNLLVQSMLALQLQRLTGSRQVLFGTTVSAELDDQAAAGLYINTIPVPVTVAAEGTLADWLAAERSRQAARTPFDFVGLAEIQRCAAVDAGESLFDLLFVFDNYPLGAGLLQPAAGLTPRGARVVEQTTFPLVLSVLPNAEIEVRLQHDAARYHPEAAASFLDGFVALLERAARKPVETPLTTLARLEGSERERVLTTWNQTAVAVPADRCVHDLVAAQVAAGPGRVAIRAAGTPMTYAELDARARQIAAALQSRKVGRGAVVGVCAGRAADTIAALLGILYAGAAYVPLDPAFPEDRLAFMLDDAGASLTLCDATAPAALRTRFAALAPVVDLADIDGDAAGDPLRVQSRPSDLMYVLYTSGSTGRPKGVQIPHRAVVNLLSTMRDDPGLSADDVVLALTTFSFDIAVVEIFLTLSVGATMVMADQAADPRHLLRLIADEKVTLVQATPATYRLLLEAGWEQRPGVRAFCGGEALSKDLSHAILQRCDRLWNLYGPTETTVYSVGCEIPRTDCLTPGAEPIGRPLANTLAYVLDAKMEPVPVGATGELFIAGAGVGDGYRGNPALTNERFVPNPFDPSRGAVMYRTGDRARWRPDGTLDYLGRLDYQVKVRGYRIELEEIESVLGGHPDVAHAVVTSREDRPGDTTLVAYVTPRSGRMDEKALREHLRTRVPDYMVPARFVQLEQMPRTPSGKVDRRALPAPAVERRREGRAAGTPLEEEVAAIIGGVLEQDAIPVNDSFFDLGGHSLHLLQVQTRMAERLGVNVEIVEFFRHPTVQDLAKLVERLREGGSVDVEQRRDRSDARLTQQDIRRQQLHARRGARAGRPRA